MLTRSVRRALPSLLRSFTCCPSLTSTTFTSSSRSFSTSAATQPASSTVSSTEPAAAVPSEFDVLTAVKLVRACSVANFDETIQMSIQLGVDPRKPNQSVRGVAALPHGTGQFIRVAVFARGERAVEAKNAGADIVGDQDLADSISKGNFNFDRVIATPDMMSVVGKVARILGPRGLMPNPKLGTVTMDITNAIKSAKQGSVEFKTEKNGIVSAAMGKASFTVEALATNIEAFVHAVIDAKPSGAKGEYFKAAHIASTQGISVPVDIKIPPFKEVTVKPTSP